MQRLTGTLSDTACNTVVHSAIAKLCLFLTLSHTSYLALDSSSSGGLERPSSQSSSLRMNPSSWARSGSLLLISLVFVTGNEAFEDDFAPRLAALNQLVNLLKVGSIDWRIPLRQGCPQYALIDEA